MLALLYTWPFETDPVNITFDKLTFSPRYRVSEELLINVTLVMSISLLF